MSKTPLCNDHFNRGKNQSPPFPRFWFPPPPPRPVPSSISYGDSYKPNNLMIAGMTIMGSILSAALMIGILCALTKYYFNSRRNSPFYFGTQDDFPNEDQGPILDNPSWYIQTVGVGLQQSVIDSIAVFKYKKHEQLIEGTECSVCLSVFQEDESLRLLPKCSHAFHLPCIDTWLRSHKNCPLCRAPVVSYEAMVVQTSASSEPNYNPIDAIPTGSSNETPDENSENYDVGDDGTSEVISRPIEDGNDPENPKENLIHSKTNVSRSDNFHVFDVESMRRSSVSLDLSSAAFEICSDLGSARIGKHEHHGSLDTAKGKIVVGKRGSESSNIYKLVKSSSIGRSLSKGPTIMKRSFSSGGKFSLSKQSRSQEQESVLPF